MSTPMHSKAQSIPSEERKLPARPSERIDVELISAISEAQDDPNALTCRAATSLAIRRGKHVTLPKCEKFTRKKAHDQDGGGGGGDQ